MYNIITLKKRKDFLRVASARCYIATYNVVVQAARHLSDTDNIYVGYTATKKIGNAVIRNRSKRRLRAVVRDVLEHFALPNVDYILIARDSTHSCKYADLRRDFVYALKKINKNFTVPEQINTDENDC